MTHRSPPSHPRPPIGIPGYFLILLILLVLLALTVWVATFALGQLGTTAALLIAGVKAALVALFFMHLRYCSRVTWAFAGAGLLWLAILLALICSDYATRGRFPRGETLGTQRSFLSPPPRVPGHGPSE